MLAGVFYFDTCPPEKIQQEPAHCGTAEGLRYCAGTIYQRQNMAQAIMEPEKVRRFAEELQRFNSDLENRLVLLHARFAALGDTWSDQEHEKFAEEFKQTMKALKKFVELSKEHTPFLLRKAQRIEEYLNQR
jgi:uncharacterized protein YukE